MNAIGKSRYTYIEYSLQIRDTRFCILDIIIKYIRNIDTIKVLF